MEIIFAAVDAKHILFVVSAGCALLGVMCVIIGFPAKTIRDDHPHSIEEEE